MQWTTVIVRGDIVRHCVVCSLAAVRRHSTTHFVFGLDDVLCPSFLATLTTAVAMLGGDLVESESESESASSFDWEIAEHNFLALQAELAAEHIQDQGLPLRDLVAALETVEVNSESESLSESNGVSQDGPQEEYGEEQMLEEQLGSRMSED